MKRRTTSRRVLVLAAAAALGGALTLAACGGGGGGSDWGWAWQVPGNGAGAGDGGGQEPPPSAPPLVQSQFELHMEASRLNTGGDPLMAHPWRAFYCNLSDDNNAIVLAERQKNSIRVPLTQLFDDVWYIGTEYVGQYILRDQNGFVMVDGGNSAQEMRDYNLPALTELGWGAGAPLHGVLITHGHRDHDGGALELKNATGAAIYLGSADAAGKDYAPLTLDSMIQEPYDIIVGGRTITVLATPGHTAGATGFVVRAKDGGKDVKLFVSGGSSLSTENIPLIQGYLRSMERTYELVKSLKIDTASNPHIYWDGSRELIYRIPQEGLKSPSQFIIGNDKLLRAMAIGRECTAAWLARKDPSAQVPVWRVSSTHFLAGSPSPNRITARVNNGWGPVAGQAVTFATERGEALCSGVTDKAGVASCPVPTPSLAAGTDRLIATFPGASSAEVVELASESSALFEDTAALVCRDLGEARKAAGTRQGEAGYDARFDMDGDGTITREDLQQIADLAPAGTRCDA
ncbi:MBL fold metallo-hydrolase [Xenophilus sp. Marseille-Q4582]|uniref:MBL fold metallo-hydrolase n=1 Tax=Xenophilus sp. Marseille-Q4582 TaxID=2866600 RepID=UPI001CE4521E|nr:MBL fold metallo-hydrolase [Xenophilus sp. Marseille-Q4582]